MSIGCFWQRSKDMEDKNIEKVFKVLEKMYRERILKNYAIGGATATIYYTEIFAASAVEVCYPSFNAERKDAKKSLDYIKAIRGTIRDYFKKWKK